MGYLKGDRCVYSPYIRSSSTLQPEGAGEDHLLEKELLEEGRTTLEAILRKCLHEVAKKPDQKEEK